MVVAKSSLAGTVDLEVRRFVPAPPEQVFRAWTDPAALKRWWGPVGVQCVAAEIDLQPGGRYRIGNALPTGAIVWIHGAFEQIDPPNLLVYSWCTSETDRSPGQDAQTPAERVTIRFRPSGEGTDLIIEHHRIPTAALRDGHQAGWDGCIDGLIGFLAA